MAIRRGRFGYSFTVIRVLQFFCFVAIAGLCSLPAAEINRLDAPKQAAPIAYALAISVLSAVCAATAVLWHICGALPYFANSIVDGVLAVLVIVMAILVGRPLTRLNCGVVGDFNEHITSLGDVLYSVEGMGVEGDGVYKNITDAAKKFSKVHDVDGLQGVEGLPALGKTREEVWSKIGDYDQWVGRVQRVCISMKIVWALAIILIFLLVATAVLSWILHRRVNSIPTFHVEENEDGSHSYYTEHVPASVMREVSMTDDEEGRASGEYRYGYADHRPTVGREGL
ncbi:uncharacterized protein H6S33_005316 [Morchella sextelata]|uniref:uncharacterized protein n=1 Tax=Morchella sextelata TaxID=1174677 RepID=UPI001D03E3A4|nr:uncharacterized protein H6S33_005316 [Morchella sextelata]KAH0613430.1 hypothetical protein H6S33_005316 [Morchella sextelata]